MGIELHTVFDPHSDPDSDPDPDSDSDKDAEGLYYQCTRSGRSISLLIFVDIFFTSSRGNGVLVYTKRLGFVLLCRIHG